MRTLTIDQVRSAAASGGVLSANLRPIGSMFALEFETRTGLATLVAAVSKQPRRFGNPLKAFEIVRELGLEGGHFSVAQWHPEEREVDRPVRPDASERMKHAHEAAAYDIWFREKVGKSMAGLADGSNSIIPDDEWQAERAQWEREARDA